MDKRAGDLEANADFQISESFCREFYMLFPLLVIFSAEIFVYGSPGPI